MSVLCVCVCVCLQLKCVLLHLLARPLDARQRLLLIKKFLKAVGDQPIRFDIKDKTGKNALDHIQVLASDDREVPLSCFLKKMWVFLELLECLKTKNFISNRCTTLC